MATSRSNVTKTYELRTLGYDQIIKELKGIDTQLQAIAKSKIAAGAAKASTRQESDEMKQINAELEQQRIKTKALLVERQKLLNEAKAEQIQRQASINQKKAETAAANAATSSIKAEANSYADLYRQQKQLYQLIKNADPNSKQPINFNGQNLSFQQAINEYARLSAAEQEFRRQFAKDKTLVGEYTTGIIQAFKKMGLQDLVGAQAVKAQEKLDGLNDEFDRLKQQLNQLKQSGNNSGLDALENDLIDNRVEAQRLEREIERINRELTHTGDVGNSVTAGLKKGFGELKGQMSQFLLGYIGLQAAISSGRKVLDVNFGFEDTVNELKAITGVAGADLEFLKKQALDTSNSTKFSAREILESFKLIASAKPELLDNVQALAEVKDAAIVLAQASGQTLPQAVDSLTKVLNQFNAGAGDSAAFIDALAAGAKFGAAEIPNITTALLDFGTQAKSSNISIHESVGLIELLAEKGIQGGEAGTKLRNVLLSLSATDALPKRAIDALQAAGVNMQKLSDTTIPLEERLREIAKIQNDNTAIVQIFGKENFNAAQIVLQNIDR